MNLKAQVEQELDRYKNACPQKPTLIYLGESEIEELNDLLFAVGVPGTANCFLQMRIILVARRTWISFGIEQPSPAG